MKFMNTVLILATLPAITLAGNSKKNEVVEFKKNAAICEHFTEEWDSDLSEEQKNKIKNRYIL